MIDLQDYFLLNDDNCEKINVFYYHLKEEKEMEDNQVISSDCLLRLIYCDDDKVMLETCHGENKNQIQIIFWSYLNDLSFSYEKEENKSDYNFDLLKKKIFNEWIF